MRCLCIYSSLSLSDRPIVVRCVKICTKGEKQKMTVMYHPEENEVQVSYFQKSWGIETRSKHLSGRCRNWYIIMIAASFSFIFCPQKPHGVKILRTSHAKFRVSPASCYLPLLLVKLLELIAVSTVQNEEPSWKSIHKPIKITAKESNGAGVKKEHWGLTEERWFIELKAAR